MPRATGRSPTTRARTTCLVVISIITKIVMSTVFKTIISLITDTFISAIIIINNY